MTDTEPLLIAGRYRLVTALASGGMGVVWEGWDERLHRKVAVKQLRVQPGLSDSEATTARNRAMREARNTARLHHPHAVPVYDVVEQDGQPCLIMEYLPSVSLQEAIRQRGTLPPARSGPHRQRGGAGADRRAPRRHRASRRQAGQRAARRGRHDQADRFRHLARARRCHADRYRDAHRHAAYLAPEVARGQPASFASDVFSLGSTLYTATEGVPPFGKDDNAMAVLHRVASGEYRMPQHSGALTPLLSRMLTADPDARPSMTEVSSTLAALHTNGGAADTAPEPATPAPPETLAFSPPTLTEVSPVRRPGPADPRRPRRLMAALLAGAVVIAAAVLVFALTRSDNNPSNGSPSQAAGGGNPTTHAARPPRPRAAPKSSASTGRRDAGAVDARQLARAITDYYALMPHNLKDGWRRLTPTYQQRTAGGFDGYKQFWDQFKTVTASNVSGQAPDTAVATITYVPKKGNQSVERTRFQLVEADGELKINASELVS